MIRTTFIASAAALAVAVSTPAVAGPGGGHGGGPGAGAAGQMGGMQGAAGAGGMSSPGATVRADARVNSQGAANANQHALDNANANSALGSSTTTTTTAPLTGTRIRPENRMSGNVSTHANTTLSAHGQLTGVTTGMNVLDTNGTAIGTVSGIVTNRSGAVVGIRVDLTGGGTVLLPATSLSMSGTTVVTSSTTTGT